MERKKNILKKVLLGLSNGTNRKKKTTMKAQHLTRICNCHE